MSRKMNYVLVIRNYTGSLPSESFKCRYDYHYKCCPESISYIVQSSLNSGTNNPLNLKAK